MPLEHLSASSINSFTRCPEAFRRRYLEGEKIPPGWAAHRGTGAHKAIEVDLAHKIATGELLPDDVIADAARDGVEHAAQFGVTEEEEFKGRSFLDVLGEVKDVAVGLARLHHQTVAPILDATAVETPFELTLEGVPIPVIGYIDILASNDIVTVADKVIDAPTDRPVLADTKTSKSAKTQRDADTSLQLTLYSLVVESMTDIVPLVRIHNLVATREPKFTVVATKRSENDYASLQARIDVMMRALDAGLFPPVTPDVWWCSEKWCGFYNTCPYAGGARRTTVG